MRWPWQKRTDDELCALAVQVFFAIREACAACPSSQHDAKAVEVATQVVAAARLKPADECRFEVMLGYLNDMLMQEALAERDAAGNA